MVWYSHLFKNFPQFVVIHTVTGFSVVNETEADVFHEFSCLFLNDPTDVGNLIFHIYKYCISYLLSLKQAALCGLHRVFTDCFFAFSQPVFCSFVEKLYIGAASCQALVLLRRPLS